MKTEIQIVNQIAYLARELKKQRKIVRELTVSVEKIQHTIKSIPKAQVVSLGEYWQLRLLLPTNKQQLVAASKKVKELERTGKHLDSQLKTVRRDKQNVQKEIDKWNRVIKFNQK